MFFFSDVDPNAKVKGSRDPLGTQTVWSTVGRTIVGNLTTQTGLLTDFRVLVVGAYLEDLFGDSLGGRQRAFLCWEQVAAYTRVLRNPNDEGFRGVTQARLRRPNEMFVSPEREYHLLGHQLANGIWGLYRAAAWRGGLLREGSPLVTGDTLEVVRAHYLPRLEAVWGRGLARFRRWVEQGHKLSDRRDAAVIEAVAECVMGPLADSERSLYLDTLVNGGLSRSRVGVIQQELADLLLRLPYERVDRTAVEWLCAEASDELRARLQVVLDTESVLAPAAASFAFLTQNARQEFAQVVATLEASLEDVSVLSPEVLSRLAHVRATQPGLFAAPHDDVDAQPDRWLHVAEALSEKDVARLLRLLIAQSGAVSRERGASVGWVRIGPDGRVDVQQVDPNPGLPSFGEPSRMWFNDYFLSQLWSLSEAVAEGAA